MDVSERVCAILDGKNSLSEIDIEGETADRRSYCGGPGIAADAVDAELAV